MGAGSTPAAHQPDNVQERTWGLIGELIKKGKRRGRSRGDPTLSNRLRGDNLHNFRTLPPIGGTNLDCTNPRHPHPHPTFGGVGRKDALSKEIPTQIKLLNP